MSPRDRPEPARSCPRSTDLTHLALGGLPASEAAELRRHVEGCWWCREELAALGSLVAELRAPPVPGAPDLAPRILGGLRRRRPLAFRGRMVAACAGMATAAGLLLVLALGGPPGGPVCRTSTAAPVAGETAITPALTWLVARQEEDGSWRAGAAGPLGGRRLATTGLCLAALAAGDLREEPLRRAAEEAVAHLLRRQGPEGRFGPAFGAGRMEHAPATFGLLRLYQRRPWSGLEPHLRQAVRHLAASAPAGSGAAPWRHAALELAGSLGYAVEPPRRGSPAEPPPGDAARTWWRARHGTQPGGSLYAALATRQVGSGPLQGSFHGPDRVYATATAVLALRALAPQPALAADASGS